MAPLPPSRVASGLYPPSSTSAATAQYFNDRALTFASEWHFKPEGVELVRKRFEEDLRKRKLEAVHGWNEEDQTFRVRCHPGDVHRVWPLFYEVVINIIKDEGGENDDNSSDVSWTADWVEEPFESKLVERLEDYYKRIGKDNAEDDIQSESSESEFEQLDRFPKELVSFTSKATWPQTEDANSALNFNLDAIALDKILKQLEVLTGCRLIKSLKESKIYIGGDSETKFNLAISKLDVLYKYQSMPTYQKHLFYSEGEEDFKVILKPIADVKMHYFKTTLLEYLLIGSKCNYPNLRTAATVRIAPYNNNRKLYASVNRVHLTPAIKLEDRESGLTEWKDFTYCRIGQPPEYLQENFTPMQEEISVLVKNVPGSSDAARVLAIANKEIKDAIIERWADKVLEDNKMPLGPSLQALRPLITATSSTGTADENKPKPSWDKYTGFTGTPVLQHEFKPRQVSDGLMKNLSTMSARREVVPSSRILQPLVTQPSATNHIPRPPSNGPFTVPLLQSRTAGSSVSTSTSAMDLSPVPSSLGASGIVSAADPDESPEAPHCKHSAATLPKIRDQALVGNKLDELETYIYGNLGRGLLDDDISVLEFTDPIMQPIQCGPAETSSEVSQILDNKQPVSEAETRIFHTTMNQRAPKPKSKSNPYDGRLPGPEPVESMSSTSSAVDPLPEFCQELEESFRDLMKPARGFRGQVQVQAEFGRVLLHSIHFKHITLKGSSDNTKYPDSLRNLLEDSADFTSFTNVLTTSAGEMPYLLKLTGADGTDLWEKKSPNWTVEYEFFFIDNFADQSQSRFRVVINAEDFGKQIKRHHPLGSIYVHGTRRHWDFRVTATGIEGDRGIEKEFDELATAVESSLYVPPDLSTPIVYFKLDEAMSKRFELAAFRVYRICRYRSKDDNSILQISEVHSLDIHKAFVPKEGLTYFKLLPGPPERKPCEKPGLGYWFEVSISSSQLDSLLEQNKTLELGEEAKWTPEGLSRLGFGQSICLRACEMLKQMDGIGQYNNNEVEMRPAQAVMENKASRTQKDDYW